MPDPVFYTEEVIVELGTPYIGSAYSPQVEITETETGHEIAITHASAPYGGEVVTDTFEVPSYASEEAAREAAEQARESAEQARAAAETARESAEDARELAETERASAETQRAAAEQARTTAESARAVAEQARVTAETGRAGAETVRVTAENARVSAESARSVAEQARVTAENARASAEAARVTAEQARQTDTAAAIASATAATEAAQTATTAAQAATAAAETATGEAEDATAAANAAAETATDAAEHITDGYFPDLTSGAALSLTNPTAAESTWARRVTDAVDGVAVVESIKGNTIVQDGELLSVNLTGVEGVGFNQIPSWELGGISSSNGAETVSTTTCRTGFIPVDPNTAYCLSSQGAHLIGLRFYDSNKVYIGASNNSNYKSLFVFTPATMSIAGGGDASSARYMRFVDTNATTGEGNCLNISNPALNGTYKPYATYQRTIPAATYFPDGMRSAGSVHDELTADAAIVRVGAVDLGTLTWTESGSNAGSFISSTISDLKTAANSAVGNLTCAKYDTYSGNAVDSHTGISNGLNGQRTVRVHDAAYTGDAAAFKAAMSGVMLYYELATPTTTPIDPPLNLTYKVERGGTEAVMHTDPTAAPTWLTRHPFDLAGTVMANIAPVEQPVATATHAIGDLLCVGWQLYRATRAIAIGEAITAGTNVTATTVAAEIAAIQ